MSEGSKSETQTQSNRVYHLFLVDDSKVSRKVVQADLDDCPHLKVHEFASAEEALDALSTTKPDLIISDVEMDGYNGYEFCMSFRELNPDHRSVPFILITASKSKSHDEIADRMGMIRVFRKPLRKSELRDYINDYLSGSTGAFVYNALLVDDSRVQRKLLTHELKALSLNIYEAASLEEAKAALDKHAIDIIYLDHVLPDGLGAEFCAEFKREEEGKFTPVIGISTKTETAMEFLTANADDYIKKPYTSEEVSLRTQKELRRIRNHRRMQELIEEERKLNNQRNQLLGVAAHDLRNPIASARMSLDLILQDLPEESREIATTIEDSMNQALKLLEETLNMSNIDAGTLSLNKTEMPLFDIIHSRLNVQRKVAQKKDIEIINEKDESVDNYACVEVDFTKICQVFDNLLSNAVKYSHTGSQVKLRISKSQEGYLFSVEDQGVGIDESETSKLFRPFTKTSSRPTGDESSTGLGLYIVKKIVEGHGGTIWAESEKGKGSTFHFTLPVED